MSSSALYETFARAPLAFEQGEGVWLVATNGPDCGKDFTLRSGANAVGTLPNMAVSMANEPGVPPENQAIIASS